MGKDVLGKSCHGASLLYNPTLGERGTAGLEPFKQVLFFICPTLS